MSWSLVSEGRAINLLSHSTRCLGHACDRVRSASARRDDLVDDAVLLGLRGRHEVVPFRVLPDLLDRLTGVRGNDLVEAAAHVDDLSRVDLDVGRLTREAG